MSSRPPRVTVAIPAYNCEAFIEATVSAVQDQTYDDLTIVISVDKSNDDSRTACRRIASMDERVTVVTQQGSLGWIGNMNAVLDLVATELFILLPHDDLLESTYVERLVASLDERQEVVNAYCDIRLVGAATPGLFSLEISGDTPYERVLSFLSGRPNGIPLRGVTRSSVLDAGVRLRPNAFNGFYAGTVYVMELLGQGACHRVAEPLYRKLVRADSVSESDWNRLPRDRQLLAWAEHGAACARAISSMKLKPDEHHSLTVALLARLRRLLLPGGNLHRGHDAATFDDTHLVAALVIRLLGHDPLDESSVRSSDLDPGVRRTMAGVRYAEGIEYRTSGSLAAAADALEAAARLDSSNPETWLQLGATDFELDRIDAGLKATRLAGELAPDDARVAHMLSVLLERTGDRVAAVAAAERALELDPGRPRTVEHLARLVEEGPPVDQQPKRSGG